MRWVTKLGEKDGQMADCHSLGVFGLIALQTQQRRSGISNSSELFFYTTTIDIDISNVHGDK